VRRAFLVGLALFIAAPGVARAATSITLSASPQPVVYNSVVHFTGSISPAAAGETVGLYRQSGSTWTLLGSTTTAANGTFSFAATTRAPGTFLVQDGSVQSAPVSVVVKPLMKLAVSGSRAIGAILTLTGRITPWKSGQVHLVVAHKGVSLHVRQGSDGRFRARLPTTRWLRYLARVRLVPAAGYAPIVRSFWVAVKLPPLGQGSMGPSVRWLETLLARQRYAALGIDRVFRYDTRDAVLAFQKVHGLVRSGYVSRAVWLVLRRAHIPLAHVRSGTHIEVEKHRQILFEVRHGRVFKVAHVSTGATGNTPHGHWHIYSKTPGFNSLGMYYSMYWYRGFAIHGYHSVPAYPASHGCVRTPIWYAPRIYSRSTFGESVYVFP